LSHEPPAASQNLIYLITLGDEARRKGAELLAQLRSNKIICDADYEGKSLKGAMRKANDLAAKYVLILGDDEIKKGTVTLKDMQSSVQKDIRLSDITKELKC
jgi:histidyl-tRNA synthetase